MARRKGKRGRGRKSKAIPVLPTLTALMPAVRSYQAAGLSAALPEALVLRYTGYSMTDRKFYADVAMSAAIPVLVGVIGHKVANKVGVNRIVKKFTFGYLTL